MTNLIRGALTGEYEPRGSVADADCAIGQSFGSSPDGIGLVNDRMAQFVDSDLPARLYLLMQQEIANALEDQGSNANFVIKGDPSTAVGGQLDSWGVLSQAQQHMMERGLNRPVLVAQAHQIGRLTMQAIRLGMDPIVPEGLPTDFDPESTQFWTRNRTLWSIREAVGIPYLRLRSKL
jgi:hypothetical protein